MTSRGRSRDQGLRSRVEARSARLVASLLCLGMLVAACGGGVGSDKGQPVTIGYTTWPEDIAVTYLWQGILEERGYPVKLSQRRVDKLFAKMAGGDIDIFMDTWLPRTHRDYWSSYSRQLDKLALWYDEATLELAVPTYMKVDSIGDLTTQTSRLRGKIIGIEMGAGESTVIKRDVLPAYGLGRDFQYVSSSTEGMLAALEGAIKNRAPIVVALWHPHWAYVRLPIKDLEDPKGAWGESERLYVTARGEFNEDYPRVARWMSNFRMSRKQLGSLMVAVTQDAHSPQDRRQAVKNWIGEHRKLVNTWVDPLPD